MSTQKTVPDDFDLNRTSKAIVTALINLGNTARNFKPEDLEIAWEAPIPTGQYPDDPDRELKVLVKATDTSYPVYVKSKDIASHELLGSLTVAHEGETSSHDLVAKINAAAGFPILVADDLLNVALPTTGDYPRSLAIQTNPKGLFWNGTLAVVLTGTATAPEPEPEDAVLTAITATPDSVSVAVGETTTVNAAPVPADAKLDGIVWTADSADVEVTGLPSGGVSIKGLVANAGVVVTGTIGAITTEVLVEVTAADAGDGE